MQEFVSSEASTLALQRPFLYRYALFRLRRADTAEDVVQDTLLAALEGQTRFRGDSALRTWLAAILKHKIVDWCRRESRETGCGRTSRSGDGEPEPDDTIDMLFDPAGRWVSPPSEWPLPDQSLESKELHAMLDRCLAMLPPATARAFYLREIEGLSTREVCAELGVTESNCCVMLHRARMKLRQYLEEHWFLHEGEREAGNRPARQAESRAVRD